MCFSSTILSVKQHVACLMGVNYKQILGVKSEPQATNVSHPQKSVKIAPLEDWNSTNKFLEFFAV